MSVESEHKLMRRVAGYHNFRLDGIGDLLMRARGASVMDIGCNRGQVGYDFAMNGASVVHGCDVYEPGVRAAREWFKDLRMVESQFEVCDLTKPDALAPFGAASWDIVLMLATYHKLKRSMKAAALSELVKTFGSRTVKYFAWRATSDKPAENDAEMAVLDADLGACGLQRVHTSRLSETLDIAAIWRRD